MDQLWTGQQRKPSGPASHLVCSAFASLKGIPSGGASPQRGSLLQSIEFRVNQELRLLQSDSERIGVFKEAAREACLALEQVAPYLSVIFSEHHKYMSLLETTSREIDEAKRARDIWERKYDAAIVAAEQQAAKVREDCRLTVAKIESRLKGAASIGELVERTEMLEKQLRAERLLSADLHSKLEAIASVKIEFQNAVHYIEQSFSAMTHERQLELAQLQVESNRLRKDLQTLRDSSRLQLMDANAAKDAVEIALANAIQREEQALRRAEGLEMRNSAVLAKVMSRSGPADETKPLLTPRPNHAIARSRVPELGAAVDDTTTESLIEAVLDRMDELRQKLQDALGANRSMEQRLLETVDRRVKLQMAEMNAAPSDLT